MRAGLLYDPEPAARLVQAGRQRVEEFSEARRARCNAATASPSE
jgi:hypothetical protein